MPAYSYAVDASVLEAFQAARARDKHELLRVFAASNPLQRGDYRWSVVGLPKDEG